MRQATETLQATRRKTLWPEEARNAARQLHKEKGTWAAVINPFTKLAKEKGWGSSYTVDSLKTAVANRPTNDRRQWTPEARKAALDLHEAMGSWEGVVEPFNKLAVAKGWGMNYSKVSIYSGAHKQPKEIKLRETGDRGPDSAKVTHARNSKRKKQDTAVDDGDKDLSTESSAARLRSSSSAAPPVQRSKTRRRRSEDTFSESRSSEFDSAIQDEDATNHEDDDPILSCMIRAYDRLSSVISDLESELAANQSKTRSVLRANAAEVNTTSKVETKLTQLKVALASKVKARNTVVARIVVQAKKHGRPGADARCSAFKADIENVQRVSHAKCAQFGAWIHRKHSVIAGLKKNVHDMLQSSDWGDESNWSDVNQLGAMAAKEQRAVRHLEADRLREFVQLFKFCKGVREAAKKMVAESAAFAERV